MRVVRMEQRTPQWLAWRAGGLGGSDAAAVLGASPWKTRKALLREKARALAGLTPPKEKAETWAMRRGRVLEEPVLGWYARFYGGAMVPVCGERDYDTLTWVRGSFDGYDAASGGALEIKVPKAQDHETALAGGVPEKYAHQLDHLLLAGEGSVCWVHYVSYSPDRWPKAERYAVVTWKREERGGELNALLEAEKLFWAEACSLADSLRVAP